MKLASFSYRDLGNVNLKDFVNRLYAKTLYEEDILSSAAQVAFYFAFALFPLLLFLTSIFGLLLGSADEMRRQLFFYLRQVMPYSAYDLVVKTLEEVTQGSSGGKLTLGLLIALYSASAGVDGIRVALNGVYNLSDARSWFVTKPFSILMTLILAILIFVALGVVFYGSRFLTLILDWINLPIESPVFLTVLQFAVVAVVLLSVFALLYNYLPKHREHTWVWITPGAVIGILLWVAVSYAFRTYLGYFDSYNKTYGSLGAMIILMLWLYLTALVILIGGSINAVLQEMTDPATAAAGINKAVAKEIVENPDRAMIDSPEASAKVAQQTRLIAGGDASGADEVLHQTNRKTAAAKMQPDPQPENAQPPPATMPLISSTTTSAAQITRAPNAVAASDQRAPERESLPVGLLAGTLFGFIAGLIFKNKTKDRNLK